MHGQPTLGLYFYSIGTSGLPCLYTWRSSYFHKQSLLHLKLFFLHDFNAVKAISRARKPPYGHMWSLFYLLEVGQPHLRLQRKHWLSPSKGREHVGNLQWNYHEFKRTVFICFFHLEVLKTIDRSWGEIKAPIYTFHGACEAEKETNPVAKVYSSLRQFHCLSVGANVF